MNLPIQNALNFPAAILAAAVSSIPKRPRPRDYGAIGAIIGHEISHSFDDQGSQFDATGPPGQLVDARGLRALQGGLGDSWSRSTTRTSRSPISHVNGQQTLSENIADVAGLVGRLRRVSPRRKAATRRPHRQGFTGDQQFFLSFAQSWRYKIREAAAAPARSSPTATRPAEYRADTVRNLDAWYAAFEREARPGARTSLPPTRVRVW